MLGVILVVLDAKVKVKVLSKSFLQNASLVIDYAYCENRLTNFKINFGCYFPLFT